MYEDPISILKAREAKRAALVARVARFADADREMNPVAQQVKQEAFEGLLASALEEAIQECDCLVASAFIETSEGCVSICYPNKMPAPELPPNSLLASGVRGDLDLLSFIHLGAQKKDQLASLVAAADPDFRIAPTMGQTFASGTEARRSAADKRLEAYLELWGAEVGAAMFYALEQSLRAIEPTEEQSKGNLSEAPSNLTAAAKPPSQRIAVRCLTAEQKTALSKFHNEWVRTIEGSLERVVADTFGAITSNASLPLKEVQWGISVPENVLVTSGYEKALDAETKTIREAPLTRDEERAITLKVKQHFEYWSNEAKFYQEALDIDNFESAISRREYEKKLAYARAQAGLDPVDGLKGKKLRTDLTRSGDNKPDDDFYWTRANIRQSFIDDLKEGQIAELEAENAKLKKRLEALDSQALKDYSRLERVFKYGVNIYKRPYVRYENALESRELSKEGLPGGFKTVSFKGMGLHDITDDVNIVLSNPAGLSDASKALSLDRVKRFLERNLPARVNKAPQINKLLDTKPFLRALINPQVLATTKEGTGEGVGFLSGNKIRQITDDGVDLARYATPTLVREIDDAVCRGESFEDALKAQRDRMDRVAKDVSNSVSNQTVLAVSEDPYFAKQEKVWISALIETTRTWHAAAHGQRRSLNKPFNVGGALMDKPLDPAGGARNVANCLCRAVTQAETPDGKKVTLSFVGDGVPK